jgi:hypothetical protein
MDFSSLIPAAETIPAPAWLFLVLDVLLFLLHILVINLLVGGSLIALFSLFKKSVNPLENRLSNTVVDKIPTTFALGVNLGVAPLLFVQVIYGHLFYSSSILMGTYWILIIPLLILAYYGAYIHVRKKDTAAVLSRVALAVSSLIVLYIAFIFVNNLTLMAQPEKWTAYFQNRNGTLLNWSDPTVIPRYLHFVTASVAVGGLFMALVWNMRLKKGRENAAARVKQGLRIFGYATIVQVIVGVWFLTALPKDFMLQFMGGNIAATIVFMLGFLCGIGAIATAFAGKLRPTISMLAITLPAMVVTRAFLRSMYLTDKFSLSDLELAPQYGVMALFFLVLVIGLAAVGYMLKAGFATRKREVAR